MRGVVAHTTILTIDGTRAEAMRPLTGAWKPRPSDADGHLRCYDLDWGIGSGVDELRLRAPALVFGAQPLHLRCDTTPSIRLHPQALAHGVRDLGWDGGHLLYFSGPCIVPPGLPFAVAVTHTTTAERIALAVSALRQSSLPELAETLTQAAATLRDDVALIESARVIDVAVDRALVQVEARGKIQPPPPTPNIHQRWSDVADALRAI